LRTCDLGVRRIPGGLTCPRDLKAQHALLLRWGMEGDLLSKPIVLVMSFRQHTVCRSFRRVARPHMSKNEHIKCYWRQFADPVADIAILGRPDTQVLLDQAKAYDDFIDSHETITITTAAMEGRAWIFALDGHRFRCTVEHRGRLLWTATDEPVTEEMSGSPILSNDGTAIGVVSVSSESGNIPRMHTGPDANLAAHLPAWFLQEIDRPPALAR